MSGRFLGAELPSIPSSPVVSPQIHSHVLHSTERLHPQSPGLGAHILWLKTALAAGREGHPAANQGWLCPEPLLKVTACMRAHTKAAEDPSPNFLSSFSSGKSGPHSH